MGLGPNCLSFRKQATLGIGQIIASKVRMLTLTKWFSVVTILSLAIATPAFADILVTPSNMGDWSFSFLDNSFVSCANCQVGQIVTGPATPPLGVGSANISTTAGNGGGASTIGTTGFNGTSLSELSALTYSTYDTTNNGSQFPFLRIHISYTNDSNKRMPGTPLKVAAPA